MNSVSQSLPLPLEPEQARADLELIESSGRAASLIARAVWFPLLVGGIVTVAAPGIIGLIGGDSPHSWYWSFAGTGIGATCAVFYGTHRVQLPSRAGLAAVVTAVVMLVGALTIAAVVGDSLRGGAPTLVVAAGLAAFALLYRSSLVAVVAGAHLAAGVAMIAADSTRIDDLATIGAGAVGCICGIAGVLLLDALAPPNA